MDHSPRAARRWRAERGALGRRRREGPRGQCEWGAVLGGLKRAARRLRERHRGLEVGARRSRPQIAARPPRRARDGRRRGLLGGGRTPHDRGASHGSNESEIGGRLADLARRPSGGETWNYAPARGSAATDSCQGVAALRGSTGSRHQRESSIDYLAREKFPGWFRRVCLFGFPVALPQLCCRSKHFSRASRAF